MIDVYFFYLVTLLDRSDTIATTSSLSSYHLCWHWWLSGALSRRGYGCVFCSCPLWSVCCTVSCHRGGLLFSGGGICLLVSRSSLDRKPGLERFLPTFLEVSDLWHSCCSEGWVGGSGDLGCLRSLIVDGVLVLVLLVVWSPGGWCRVVPLVLPSGAVVDPPGAVVVPPGAVVVPLGVVVPPRAVMVRSLRGAVSSVVAPAGVRGWGLVRSYFLSGGRGTLTRAWGRLSFSGGLAFRGSVITFGTLVRLFSLALGGTGFPLLTLLVLLCSLLVAGVLALPFRFDGYFPDWCGFFFLGGWGSFRLHWNVCWSWLVSEIATGASVAFPFQEEPTQYCGFVLSWWWGICVHCYFLFLVSLQLIWLCY